MNFLLPLIAHFLGDFIFQSSLMAQKKKTGVTYFLLHCLIYAIFIILALIWFGPIKNVLIAALIIIISHMGIDYIKNIVLNRLPQRKTLDFVLFIVDQILHIIIILGCVYFIKETNSLTGSISDGILKYLSWKELYNGTVLAFLYIICLSPTAILIKKVFILFSFQNETETGDLIKSGYLIGVLERVIIVTLWLNGQLGTIGFVLAAKSLARFKQLNDRNFAEKYLVGTLLSVAIALFSITMGNFLLVN